MNRPPRSTWYGVGRSDIGLVRDANQDAFLLRDELGLWLIADGMGGHPGGDVASHMAVETTVAHMTVWTRPGERHRGDQADGLRRAVIQANAAIRAEGEARPEYKGMGTTLTALHIAGPPQARATIAHVGDSRAYLHRAGVLSQLTRDHSWVEDQVRTGLLSALDAAAHPLRHVLTRALGIEPQVEPDILTLDVRTGDRILLCTDGLTKMLRDADILDVLNDSKREAQAVCDELVRRANERGGQDNVTVVLVSDRIDRG